MIIQDSPTDLAEHASSTNRQTLYRNIVPRHDMKDAEGRV